MTPKHMETLILLSLFFLPRHSKSLSRIIITMSSKQRKIGRNTRRKTTLFAYSRKARHNPAANMTTDLKRQYYLGQSLTLYVRG